MIYYTQRLFLVCLFCLLSLSVAQAQAVRFTLQVEALDDPDPALELVQYLQASGVEAYYLPAEVPGRGLYYRVRVGTFPDMVSARHRGEQLRRSHVIRKYYVTRYEGKAVAFPNNIPKGYHAPHRPAPVKKVVVPVRRAHPTQVRLVERHGSHTCVGVASVTWRCTSKPRVAPRRTRVKCR